MINNFDQALNEVKNQLFDVDIVKQYFYYKNLVENDKNLKNIDEEMRFHQKQMCQNKETLEIYENEKKMYEDLKKIFENNPVLLNYQNTREEVFSLLVDIKQFLS